MREVSQNKFPLPDNLTLYQPQGCKACDNIGYRGQVGIFEIMHISREITRLIASRAAPEEIYNQAIKEGMFTLVQDGLRKVIRGETTLEELKRVN